MFKMTDKEFESAINEALESIPPRFLRALDNIEIVMQDEPDPEQLECLEDGYDYDYEDEYEDEYEDGGDDGEPYGDDECGNASDDEYDDEYDDEDEDGYGPDELFGLYEGIALTERGEDYGMCPVPDVITIFKGPHERSFDSREQVVQEIGKTVIHEIGHYFGLDDDKLYEMGY